MATNPLPVETLPSANTELWVQQIQNQTLTSQCPTSKSCTPTNQVVSIATDTNGNVIIGGETLTVMPGVDDFAANHTSFVAKYDSTGKQVWIRQFGPATLAGFTEIFSITTDERGDTYAGGVITGSFAGYTNTPAQTELMLVEIDPEGNLLKSQQYATGLDLIEIAGGSIRILPSGQVVFGWLSAGSTIGSANESLLYVVDPSTAKEVWKRSYAGANELQQLTSDQDGNLYGTGVSLGPFPGVSDINGATPSPLPFAVKFDGTTGDVIWQQSFEEYLNAKLSFATFPSIALDTSNNVLLGGAITAAGSDLCQGICDFPTVKAQAALIAKLNGTTGEIVWTEVVSSGAGDGVTGITTDHLGNSFAVGFTNGILSDSFSQPTQNLFALKLDDGGHPVWVQQFGEGAWQFGLPPTTGIQAATDSSGNLFVGGETQGAFPGAQNPSQLGEAFVIKFGP